MSRANDISRELDTYISRRRTQEPIEPVQVQEPVVQEEVIPVVEDVSSDPDFVEKKSWFSNLMEKVFGPDEDELVPEAVGEEVTNVVPSDELQTDMRNLAEISLGIIRRLPQRTLEDFKSSDDFGQFKEILRKHSIIK